MSGGMRVTHPDSPLATPLGPDAHHLSDNGPAILKINDAITNIEKHPIKKPDATLQIFFTLLLFPSPIFTSVYCKPIERLSL